MQSRGGHLLFHFVLLIFRKHTPSLPPSLFYLFILQNKPIRSYFSLKTFAYIATDHELLKFMSVHEVHSLHHASQKCGARVQHTLCVLHANIHRLFWCKLFWIKTGKKRVDGNVLLWLYRVNRSRRREPPHFSSFVMQTLASCCALMWLPEDLISLRWTGSSSMTHQMTLRYNTKGEQYTFLVGYCGHAQ